VRLVDVAQRGRGRRYLIERALTAGEADALVADYLAEATALGDCPMRTSHLAQALEAMCDDTFRSMPTTGAAGGLTAAGVVNWSFGPRQTTSLRKPAFGDDATIVRSTNGHSTRGLRNTPAIGGDDATGRATAAHALNTRLLEEIVRPRVEGTRIAVFSPIRGID
jgi:hypothetical protein